MRRWASLVTLAVLVGLTRVRAGSEGFERTTPVTSTPTGRPDPSRAGTGSGPGPQAPPWRAEGPVPIAVREGVADFDIPSAGPSASNKTLVIVSALARTPGPFAVRLTGRPVERAQVRPPTLAHEVPRREVRLKPVAIPAPAPASRRPASAERTFHLMVRSGDVASASNYLAVKGSLRATGKRVAVYVDSADLGRVGDELLRDLVATFDGRVIPGAATTYGWARDVDGDGRFTVLMSSWLTRLAGGQHAVDGFVRGADFDPTLPAPFGNRCDMMYLSTALEPGPHLRTILAHEYAHAVTLCSKAFAVPANGPAENPVARPHAEEEGWLDEGQAHLVEDLHGFSRSNLDYRISAFLSQPSRYRLVVEDYYEADLFRSHGNRGGTYLFLRWCADRFGPSLLPALIRSDRKGIPNLEAATGVPFAELYRDWTVAVSLSGLAPDAEAERPGGYRSIDLRRPVEMVASGVPREVLLTGTSSEYVVIEPPRSGVPALSIRVWGPAEADLQVTAIPLPDPMARLSLTTRVVAGPDGARLLHARLQERRGVAVELSAMAWEPLVPGADPRSASFRRDQLDRPGILESFGTTTLAAGGTLSARPIALPEVAVPLVVKVVGTDAHGRRVAAWSDVPAPRGGPDDEG
jgi:hypothetical protein